MFPSTNKHWSLRGWSVFTENVIFMLDNVSCSSVCSEMFNTETSQFNPETHKFSWMRNKSLCSQWVQLFYAKINVDKITNGLRFNSESLFPSPVINSESFCLMLKSKTWCLCRFVPGGLKSERSSVVSSLDCLSSIVERISTDTSSLLPAADGPASPTTPPTGEAAAPGPVQIPSPTASQDPNLIYQVL